VHLRLKTSSWRQIDNVEKMLTDSLGAVQSDLHALIKAVRTHTGSTAVAAAPEISLVHDSELYYVPAP
jgi:predicted P-loop ATPase